MVSIQITRTTFLVGEILMGFFSTRRIMGFFSRSKNANILQSESSIEKKIKSAYLLGGNLHGTNINWEDFERFAQDHGGRTDKHEDGGQDTAFSITIDGTELKVIAIRDRLDGTTRFTSESYEVFKKRAMARCKAARGNF